jgi:ribosomal-protein-alanine N-acetyltransferase
MSDRKQNFFLQGQYVALKVLDEQDIETSNWYDWFNDEETTLFMQKHYFPNTRDQQLEYWKNNIRNSNDKMQLGICEITGGPIFGCISLDSINYINKTAAIAIIIGEKSSRNFRYFVEANQLMLKHGFDSLNLNRIYGGSISKDVAEAYKRALGFKMEGISRSHVYKNGAYHDVYLFGLLKSEFNAN